MIKRSIASIAVRGITLGIKFFFVAYFIKILSIQDYGKYAYFISITTLASYIIGCDFYTYYTRKFILDPSNKFNRIATTILFYFFLYIITSAVIFSVASIKNALYGVKVFFLCILILEVITQEFNRVLNILELNVQANYVIFFKNAFWLLPCFSLMYFDDKFKVLSTVYSFWLFGLVLALVYSIVVLKQRGYLNFHNYSFGMFKPDIEFIKSGIKVSIVFLLSSLMFKFLSFFDKSLILKYEGELLLGVYSFYYNLAFVLTILVEVGVVFPFLPRLISFASNDKEGIELNRILSHVKKYVILICVVFVMIAIWGIDLFLYILNRPELEQYKNIYYLLILASVIYSLSLIPHYEMYVKNRDKKLLLCSLIGFLLFVSLGGFVGRQYGALGIGVLLCLTNFTVLILKIISNRSAKVIEGR